MEKERIESILSDVKNKSNKDLFDAEAFLFDEFEKTKKLVIDLTKHMDMIEEFHGKITEEIEHRKSI
jgi:hypothetical protein